MSFATPDKIKSFTIPDTVTSFSGNLGHLRDLKEVEEIVLSKNITELPYYCCEGLTHLKSINLENITTFGARCLRGTALKSVEFNPNATFTPDPDYTDVPGVFKDYNGALAECTELETAILPANMTAIPNGLFNMCTNLKSVTIPASVTKIGNVAFSGCYDITLTVPDTVTEFGESCFQGMGKIICSPNSPCAQYCASINKACEYSTKLDIGQADITLSETTYTYNGVEKGPNVTVTYNGTKLKAATDYTVTYLNNKDAGTASVIVTGQGNYTGSKVAYFKIEKGNLDDGRASISYTTHAYTGSELKPGVTVRNSGNVLLTKGVDYTVTYTNNLNVGTATATVEGIGNYTGTKTFEFSITPLTMPAATWANSTISQNYFVYSGEPCTPYTTIEVGDQTAGVRDLDYTYENNVNVGTATVTATGKGNFVGTFTKQFVISQKYMTASDITVTADPTTYIPTVKMGNKTLTLNVDYTYAIDKTYINDGVVTTVVTGKGNFTGSKSVNTYISHTHSYGSWTTTTAATCTTSGVKTRTCSCGQSETQSIPALGHSYTSSVKAPTCTEKGYTKHTCTRCGDSYKDNYTDAKGHTYTTKVVVPTTSAEGYTLHTCSICGNSYKDNYTDKLTGHTHSYTSKITKSATCGEAGVRTYTCACGDSYTETIPKLEAHTFGNWMTTKAATCAATGTQTRTCSVCGKTETKSIAKTSAHTYTVKVVAPTTASQGYTLHTCSVCGNSYKDNFKAVLAKKSMSKVTVTGIPKSKYYTGKAIKPVLTLKYNGKTLKAGTDYTIKYTKNKAIGKAAITIKGKGDYTGTRKITFKIIPKKTTLKSATSPKTKKIKVKYSKVSNISGYQIVYSKKADFSSKKTVTTTKTSKTISKLTKGKTYYIKVRTYKKVGGVKYYSGYSFVKKIKVK